MPTTLLALSLFLSPAEASPVRLLDEALVSPTLGSGAEVERGLFYRVIGTTAGVVVGSAAGLVLSAFTGRLSELVGIVCVVTAGWLGYSFGSDGDSGDRGAQTAIERTCMGEVVVFVAGVVVLGVSLRGLRF